MATIKDLETELEVVKASLAIEREKNRALLAGLRYLKKVLSITLDFVDKLDDRISTQSHRTN